MKQTFLLGFLIIASCVKQGVDQAEVSETNDDENAELSGIATSTHASTDSVEVSAFLIYEDGQISEFDILNDKSVALWNVIIGDGSAERSSNKTKIVIRGRINDVDILIRNNDLPPIEKKAVDIMGELEIVVSETGCSPVDIVVAKQGKDLYRGVIPFGCGE
jgi:hypothetical protein